MEVNNGEVILKGAVEERFMKTLAEDIAEAVHGVTLIENRLRVQDARQNRPEETLRTSLEQPQRNHSREKQT